MDQKIKRLFEELHANVRQEKTLDPRARELLSSKLYQLEDALDQQTKMYESVVRKQGASTERERRLFSESLPGQNILRRAMAADPARTEMDLIDLGARGALTLVRAEHDADLFRRAQASAGAAA